MKAPTTKLIKMMQRLSVPLLSRRRLKPTCSSALRYDPAVASFPGHPVINNSMQQRGYAEYKYKYRYHPEFKSTLTRSFSSSTTTATNDETANDNNAPQDTIHLLREKSSAILEIPKGKLTSNQLLEAAELMHLWITSLAKVAGTRESVEASFQLWERLLQEWHPSNTNNGNHNNQQITTMPISAELLGLLVLNWESGWSHSKTASKYTPAVVFSMAEQTKAHTKSDYSMDTVKVYNPIIRGYQKFERDGNKMRHAENLQQVLNSALFASSSSSSSSKSKESSNTKSTLGPNTFTYEAVMEAWLDTGNVQKVIQILQNILNDHNSKSKSTTAVRFGSPIFEAALQVCGVSKNGGVAADQVLKLMQAFYQAELLSQKPTVGHYTQVIQAWAKSKHPQAGQRAMEVLDYLLLESSQNNQQRPDATTYSAVFLAWAQLGDMEQAETLLTQMCSDHIDGKIRAKPDVQCFGTVLDAWAQARSYHDRGERAERLLGVMWTLREENPTSSLQHLLPDAHCYNSVMHAYVKSQSPTAATECERLYQELLDKSETFPALEPTTKTYGILINAWAQCGEADHASAILSLMCERYQDGEHTRAAEPDTNCFNVVLNAIAKSETFNAGEEANRLLQQMWQLVESDFSNVRPTAVSYNSAIDAWAKSGHGNAGEEAEHLLLEMQEKYQASGEDPRLQPTIISYNSAMNACAKCGDVDGAKAIFSQLQHDPGDKKTRSHQGMPSRNIKTYNILLNALSRSGDYDKGTKADSILLAMELRGLKPDVITFKQVHKCWKQNRTTDKAMLRLDIIEATIDELERIQ